MTEKSTTDVQYTTELFVSLRAASCDNNVIRYGVRPVVDPVLRAAMVDREGISAKMLGAGVTGGGTGPTLAAALRLYFQEHAPQDLANLPMILELIGDSPERFTLAMQRLTEQ